VLPVVVRRQRAGGGTRKGTPFMYGAGKSDCCVVPVKVPNKPPRGERRDWREGSGSRIGLRTRGHFEMSAANQGDFQACGKPQSEIKDYGSLRCCIM